MVSVAISPSVRTSDVALLVMRRLRKRSSCAMSVEGANAIDERAIDQSRFVRRIECEESGRERVEVIEHTRAVRTCFQANGAESNLAADQNDLQQGSRNWS